MSGFVGRRRQLAELARVLKDVVAGGGDIVVVSGEAGIGKTRLCEEFADRALERGVKVAWARCWEAGTTPAFWLWEQLLRQLTDEAVPATGPPGLTTDPDLDRMRFFDDVVAQVRRAASESALLLVVDDLHWADVASVRLLAYLASSQPTMSVLTLATYRSDEFKVGTPLGGAILALSRLGHHVRLGALDVGDLLDLIRSAVPGEGPVDAEALHHLTGGNPLFAQELARLLDAQGSLDRLSGRRAPPVPATVRAVLARRLGRLPEDCRAVLETGAVVGDEFSLGVVGAVTGVPPERLLELVGAGLAAHVLREAGVAAYAFAHPLLRATLYEDLGVARRVRLHQRVGLALEGMRAAGHEVELAALAHHFINSASGGSAAKAVAYAVQAAESAMARFAYESAVLLYEQSLSVLDLDPSVADRCALLLGLGAAQVAAGSVAAARSTHRMAAELARATRRADLLAAAALGLGRGGFEVALADREQIELLEEARLALGDEPGALLATVTARLSVALSLSGALERRLALAEEAVTMARAAGDPVALAYALCAHCDAIAGPADTVQRWQEATEIVELAVAMGDRATEALGRRLRVVALLELGRATELDAEIEAYARLAELIRQPLYGWYVPLWRGTRAIMRGELEVCAERVEEAAAIGAEAESDNAAILTDALRWYMKREAGDMDHTALLEGLLPHEPVLGTQVRVTVSLILADAGRREEARARLDADAAGVRAMPVDSEWVSTLVQLAQVIAQVGSHPLAQWAYEALLPHRHLFGVEGIGAAWSGSVERPLGLLAAAMGRARQAEAHFEAAVAANRAAGSPLFVARTLRDAGLALGDGERLTASLAAYRELGVKRRVAELEAELARRDRASPNVFRREDGVWALGFDGELVRLKDAKGLRDLAVLLARPGHEIAAVDLAAAPGAPPQRALDNQVDARATHAYKARLAELEGELEQADRAGDAHRSERAQQERDAIVAQLAAAYGLGGRPRRVGGSDERARQAVSWRIRDALTRIERVHPQLAGHLRRAVRTGTFCVYDPPDPVDWSL